MTEIQWITREQINAILKIIIKQCNRIEERNQMLDQEFPDLYDAQYYIGRKNGNTAAVYAGFNESTKIPGMTIRKIRYGRIHWQPELYSDTAVIQLYNAGAGTVLNSKEIRDKCRQYNQPGSDQRYGAIQFWMSSKGHLTKAEFVEFDEKGTETRRTQIYKYSEKMISFVA